jgi:poly-beta-1,6-N-acetyl-D-glucosamine synthase
MISDGLLGVFHAFGLIIFILGVQSLVFFPLTVIYEIWKRRKLKSLPPFTGLVSVLVPAYNEERTIRASVESILRSGYGNIELIVINDGSTDNTESALKDLIDAEKIVYIAKPNGGKASALNRGIDAARGEVVLFTDADSIFRPDTVEKMTRWFSDPAIDAVCGNDAPLNPGTAVQKFLTITTHIGTGFVRRALSIIGCLPIITGNLGAVRTTVLRDAGGFREIWGEDLELAFRLHKADKRIVFDPEPEVLAECPGTVAALWKQRVRWMRSYIKIAILHRDLFLNPRYRPFSFYLPVNFLNMAVVPLLQLALLLMIPWALATDHLFFETVFDILTYLGIVLFLIIAVYSLALDRAVRDLVYLPYGMLILPFSYFYNAVALYSWGREIQGAAETWEKIERRPMMQSPSSSFSGWKLAAVALLLIVLSSAGTYFFLARLHIAPGSSQQSKSAAFDLGLSTHFDAWGDWKDAVRKVMDRPEISRARVIGVGAGRPEWVYFRWVDHADAWANHQNGAKTDLLLGAARTFHKEGFRVAAIIDIYAPKYIQQHGEAAAVRFDGQASPEQVSLTELVEGAYGERVLSMIEYVSANYPLDIINLTELSYYDYSFSKNDLASFKRASGRKDWPRDRKGLINKDDPSVWDWKTTMMERFLEKAAVVVHRNGKEFYVDVPVSWKDFKRNGREAGLDYRRVLKHADKIIVWNYYYLENLPPTVSEDLARYLAANYPLSGFYVSIGLWGKKEHVDPASFKTAVESTLRGGAAQIWITPNDLVTAKHWEGMLPSWKGEFQ